MLDNINRKFILIHHLYDLKIGVVLNFRDAIFNEHVEESYKLQEPPPIHMHF